MFGCFPGLSARKRQIERRAQGCQRPSGMVGGAAGAGARRWL